MRATRAPFTNMPGPNRRAGQPQHRRSVLAERGITTLFRFGKDVAIVVPRALVRQLGLVPGQLVSWEDVGQDRLLLRKAQVIVYGTNDVSAH